jgi:HTH-type transcriptional regulator/antitoxin HigA
MDIPPLSTEADYQNALKAAAPYFDNEPELGSKEAEHFELLVTLIEAFENKHYR